MPYAESSGARLWFEEIGEGRPIVFVHEFGADLREWEQQVRWFSREYRCIRFNARGYPPSDVPDSDDLYGYGHSADDILAVLDAARIDKAHIVPRPGGRREDDGYLAAFVYDPARQGSNFVLLNARRIEEAPVAVVELPQRVPQGLHGNWMQRV